MKDADWVKAVLDDEPRPESDPAFASALKRRQRRDDRIAFTKQALWMALIVVFAGVVLVALALSLFFAVDLSTTPVSG